MMFPLEDIAHAKINIYLHVTGRREDGYHLLDSLAVFAGAGDRVFLTPPPSSDTTEATTLSLTGPFAEGLKADSDNLVLRAAHHLRQKAFKETNHLPDPVHFILEKNLPVSSGIGGGSADAACALRLLTQYWKLPSSYASSIAPDLGADIPVCLKQTAQRMENIGDHLSSAPPLPALGIILVNPRIAVSTPAIFQDLNLPKNFSKANHIDLLETGWENTEAFIKFLKTTRNDLQPSALKQVPMIGDVLQALSSLPAALLTRMSGSGATCFALFESTETALAAHKIFLRQNASRNWWSWAGEVLP